MKIENIEKMLRKMSSKPIAQNDPTFDVNASRIPQETYNIGWDDGYTSAAKILLNMFFLKSVEKEQ